jgi:hypothetical protein
MNEIPSETILAHVGVSEKPSKVTEDRSISTKKISDKWVAFDSYRPDANLLNPNLLFEVLD